MTASRVNPNHHGQAGLVDIHCHLLPGIDDGSRDLEESLEMARMAVADGIETVIVTPHQLGNFPHNTGDAIRQATRDLQRALQQARIPLRVLPGADVRIEETMVRQIVAGSVLSLADRRKHVLLELPHELFVPLTPVLRQLHGQGMVGILSHPERNQGILQQRSVLQELVKQGCLMQVTAGSLTGSMGKVCQEFSRWMLQAGLIHMVATDAHGVTQRRPLLRRAWQEIARLADTRVANQLCCENPRRIANGEPLPQGRSVPRAKGGWFRTRKAG